MKQTLFLMSALGLALFIGVAQQQGDDNRANGPESMPGELLVQFKAGATAVDHARALGRVRAEKVESVVAANRRQDGRGELMLVKHQPDFTPADARRGLASDPSVEFAEPNWIYRHQATSNDPGYTGGSLWGMYGSGSTPANQYGSGAAAAWAAGKTGSASVYVGIIDEGVQYAHQDLQANIWVNPFDAIDGKDNDGNGYVDDVRGWDFDGRNNSTYDGTSDDHGTHVAGTIGGVGGNGIGVAGVNWQVTLMNAKFLGRRGGTTANAIKAVDYFTDLKNRHGLNIVATNNSWGGGGFSQGLLDAIKRANTANILFVAAAGNGGNDGVGDNNDTTANYPSNYDSPNVIAVASITSTGARSSFSNYGKTMVDLGAPGSAIYSTLPNQAGNGYGTYSGTSMATPHVTGAVALYAASNPGATAAQIKAAILGAVTPTPSLSGITASGGRLNVSNF